jgi:hydrogenase nickel incorporation protein HypB
MSGPGSGKTTLLERTAEALKDRVRLGFAVGDIQTSRDADRIARHGVPVVQINTGDACHLDARMVAPAADRLLPLGIDLLIVENVGNLVCPAEFEIGEDAKVVMLSVTEGADKPAKYPLMFHVSRLLLLSKVDLLPHVDFPVEAAIEDARALNPDLQVIPSRRRPARVCSNGWTGWWPCGTGFGPGGGERCAWRCRCGWSGARDRWDGPRSRGSPGRSGWTWCPRSGRGSG